MSYERNDLLEFGAYQIDVAQRVLQSGSHPIPLAPKLFDNRLHSSKVPATSSRRKNCSKRAWPDTFAWRGTFRRCEKCWAKATTTREFTEELINALSNVPGLRVATRATAF